MNMKTKKIIAAICRVLLGTVFIFSGFVKAVDPMGSAYKFHDYFAAFGMPALDILSVPAAFFLSALEFTLGVCLLAGVYRKIVSGLTLLVMCFMTVLTLWIAISNPVSDCGCFGDALILTNWQTFYKNIVLLAAAICVFYKYCGLNPQSHEKELTAGRGWQIKSAMTVLIITVIFILGISLYCYRYLPILDFRPYKIGNNIYKLREIPEDAEPDVYETTLVYEKDGVKQSFSIENYPKDETWTFVEANNKLVKKGYEPPIHDFTITTEDGEDITDQVLENYNYTFLLIAHKLDDASTAHNDRINEIYAYALKNEYKFMCLTASTPDQIAEWKKKTGAEYPFCTMDDVTLKTIIRSNPGLMLIHNGTIVNKWSHNRLPNDNDLSQQYY
ncbi:hypothetical protein FACS1894162_0430 [Bacteroidia bacterium]|nr:hypothetical protein FACS1894162_0430 [Bacteroidia bacterium]